MTYGQNSNELTTSRPFRLFFLPTYALAACLLTSVTIALRFSWTTSWVRLAFFAFLTTAWLACFTVNPSLAFVSAKPFLETVACHYFFFLDLLPQFFAPTLRHLTRAPDAYADGQTLYLAFTLL